jgi:hypothetical protein
MLIAAIINMHSSNVSGKTFNSAENALLGSPGEMCARFGFQVYFSPIRKLAGIT